MIPVHRVWADVDLAALRGNVLAIRQRLLPGTRLMAVVKADAYHAGAVRVAQELRRVGVDAFGVGDSSEAIELRDAGVKGLVLILGAIIPGEAKQVVARDVSICIHSQSRLEALVHEAHRIGRRCRVHLKIDTGLGRLGVMPSKALPLARLIARHRELVFEGVATHLAGVSLGPDPENERQLEVFAGLRARIHAEGLGAPAFHASASPGILARWGGEFDMVRCGQMLHGIPPSGAAGREAELGLQPVLSVHSQVVFLKDVPAGASVGYQRTYRTSRPTRIATIPMGYNDGLPPRLSNVGHVLVRGRPAPIVGAVSMDYTTVDVGDIPGVRVGDRVTWIGSEGEESISVWQVAGWAGSIPPQVLCSLGNRVAREYLHPLGVERSAAAR